ncbi:SpaA isopeptide-forming pilin-related protein [uncultured Dubosiella sp.]|uniref:SpaA isopeptide-forming pilin-related protein n=1 Tax=uncultured Dubosiella sp. TaxID=1937011 RepID=UPI00266F2530|nr:SpaA isopeptide-forming pilin-related protein [uncultured Dubosiella sp.]
MKKTNKKRSWKQIVSILSCIVVFCTTYALILPAVTMSKETYCGKEEHTHTENCYVSETPLCGKEEAEASEGHVHDETCYEEVRNLICGLEESETHIHTDECYETTTTQTCGKEESEPTEGHTHSDECYKSEELQCGKEEHEHTRICESNKEDVEDPADWEKAYQAINDEEDAKTRILTVAKNELGTKENKNNFELDEEEKEHYYTRYGHLYEDQYGDWNNYFTGYVLKYANIQMSYDKDASKWQNKTIHDQKEEGEEGNVVFFRNDKGELRTGIVTSIDDLKKEIRVIEGDVEGEVKEERINKDKVIAYLNDQIEIMEEDTPLAGEEAYKNSKTYEDEKISVKVSYNDDADIPEDAELVVKEITEESDPEHYNARKQEYLEQIGASEDNMDAQTIEEVEEAEPVEDQIFLLHDISFQVDGEEVEPKTQVKVEIIYKDEMIQDVDFEDLKLVHFKDDDTKETLELDKVEKKEKELETHFKMNSFSEVGGIMPLGEDAGSGNLKVIDNPTVVNGVTVKMFNYGPSIHNAGGIIFVNNAKAKYTSYYGVTQDVDVSVDGNNKDDNLKNLVANNDLGTNGYPVVKKDGKGQDYNLGYLFGAGGYGQGEAKNGGGLFQIDSDGNYYYDSARNAAYFDKSKNTFDLYNKLIEMPYESADGRGTNFLPFNNLMEQQSKLIRGTDDKTLRFYTPRENEKLIDLWFGMEIEFEFLMPKDGLIDGKPMQFSFRGDDDVYVYIDDKLVVDLGGCHGPQSATIDFSNGTVTHSDKSARPSKPNGVNGKLNPTFTEIFGNENLNSGKFKNYTTHKFKMFYLERGGYISNCQISFNMPTIPNNTLQVAKTISYNEEVDSKVKDYLNDNLIYRFKVLNQDGNSQNDQYFNSDKTYDVYPRRESTGGADFEANPIQTSVQIGEDGFIELKANEVAVFNNVMEDRVDKNTTKYYVQEWLPENTSGAYQQVQWQLNGSGGSTTTESFGTVENEIFKTFKTGPLAYDGNNIVRFDNKVDVEKMSLLTIKKEMSNGNNDIDDTFKIHVQIKDEASGNFINLKEGTPYTVLSPGNIQKTLGKDSIIELKAGETANFPTVLIAGTQIKVTEVGTDEVSFKSKYEAPNYKVWVGNETPESGDTGTAVLEQQSLNFIVQNKYKAKVPNRIQIKKVDENGETPLSGAKFKLYVEDSSGTQINGLGSIKVSEVKKDNQSYETKETDEDGITTLDYSLDPTKVYYLIESQIPDGYLVPQYGFKLFYGEGGKLHIASMIKDDEFGEPVEAVYSEDLLTSTVAVKNTAGQSLPNTGGAGTQLFTFSGGAIIAASSLMYGYKKRSKRNKTGKGGK